MIEGDWEEDIRGKREDREDEAEDVNCCWCISPPRIIEGPEEDEDEDKDKDEEGTEEDEEEDEEEKGDKMDMNEEFDGDMANSVVILGKSESIVCWKGRNEGRERERERERERDG